MTSTLDELPAFLAAALIGALPIPIFSGGDVNAQAAGLLGLPGLSGGTAFLIVSRRTKSEGDEA